MKRVAFDFDGTLDNFFGGGWNTIKEDVRKFCKKLISLPNVEVYIITRRFDKLHQSLINDEPEHTIVYKLAEKLGVSKENVFFTNREWKKDKVEELKIDIHLDDDSEDCKHINESGKNCIAVCLDKKYNPEEKNWETYIHELLNIKE